MSTLSTSEKDVKTVVFLFLKQVDMVDMEEMRDFMDKEQFSEFTVNAGSWYELPVDSSLNQVEEHLRSIYGKKALSRKTIFRALSDLAKSSSNDSGTQTISKEDSDYLYDQVIQQRYRIDSTKGSSARTHPATIYWEEVPLIEALTVAKSKNRKVVGEDLAHLTLDNLLETHLPTTHVPEAERSFISLHLLRNEYAQQHLIQKHQEQLTLRLNLIYSLALHHAPSISMNNMRLTFPALDTLIADMLANSSPEPSKPQEVSCIKHLNDLYDNLCNIRDQSSTTYASDQSSLFFDTEIKFTLPTGHELLDPLQKGLHAPWRNMPSTEKVALRKYYEQYLLYHFEQTEDAKEIHSFLEKYRSLSAYIQGNESWEEIQPAIRKELQEYIRWIFHDVQSGDIVPPYTYSEYEEKTASSAFIANLTKYAHDQIRAAVHHPLRLLLTVYYIKALNLLELRESAAALEGNFQAIQACLTFTTGANLRVDDAVKSFDDILSPILDTWMEQAERAIETLKNEHPHLPLTTVAEIHDLSAFLDAYEGCVPEFFSEGRLTKELLLSCAKSISSDTSLLSKVLAVGEFLRASAQLVAADIAKNALEEIGERYQALRDIYIDFRKNLESSPQQ